MSEHLTVGDLYDGNRNPPEFTEIKLSYGEVCKKSKYDYISLKKILKHREKNEKLCFDAICKVNDLFSLNPMDYQARADIYNEMLIPALKIFWTSKPQRKLYKAILKRQDNLYNGKKTFEYKRGYLYGLTSGLYFGKNVEYLPEMQELNTDYIQFANNEEGGFKAGFLYALLSVYEKSLVVSDDEDDSDADLYSDDDVESENEDELSDDFMDIRALFESNEFYNIDVEDGLMSLYIDDRDLFIINSDDPFVIESDSKSRFHFDKSDFSEYSLNVDFFGAEYEGYDDFGWSSLFNRFGNNLKKDDTPQMEFENDWISENLVIAVDDLKDFIKDTSENLNVRVAMSVSRRQSLLKKFQELLACNEACSKISATESDEEFFGKDSKQKRKEKQLLSREYQIFNEFYSCLNLYAPGIFCLPIAKTAEEKIRCVYEAAIASERFVKSPSFLYQYDNKKGYYQRLLTKLQEEQSILSLIPKRHRQMVSSHTVNEVLYRIKMAKVLQVEESFFNKDHHGRYVNCLNGVYDLKDRKLLRKKPLYEQDWNFNYCNEANYLTIFSEHITPTTFENFVKTSMGNVNAHTFLYDIIGALCNPGIQCKTAFFLVGETNTGKTKIGDLIRSIVGEEDCSAIAFHDLNKFLNTGYLLSSRVNIHTEISTKPIRDISAFKIITGHDYVEGNTARGMTSMMSHRCKMLFAGNHLPIPRDSDLSRAFIDRVTIAYFPKEIPIEGRNPRLGEKLIKTKDKIFTVAMRRISTDFANREFDPKRHQPDNSKEYQEWYMNQVYLIPNFFEDCCDYRTNAFTPSKDFYDAFLLYAKENTTSFDIGKYNQGTFTRHLLALTKAERRPKRVGENKSPVSGIRDLVLNDAWLEKLELYRKNN